MITIMVNENMTQRGNESLGAAMDSVAAVIRKVVENLYGVSAHAGRHSEDIIRGQLESEQGIGRETILKDPSGKLIGKKPIFYWFWQ